MASKKQWSLIDAQIEMRDSQDRQGRFPSPITQQLTNLRETDLREAWGEHKRRQKLNPAARSAQAPRSQKRSRPSPDRLRERSGSRYNEMTYSQPDISSSGLGETKSGWSTPASAREIAVTPSWRGGSIEFENPNTPTRRMANGGFRPSPERRQASTESAYRAADASMFNSNVTPKAAPIEDYKPRGKTVRSLTPQKNTARPPKRPSFGTNIQAFY